MEVFKEYRNFTVSMRANSENENLIVFVETDEYPNDYSTEEEPGPADVFDNLYDKYNDIMDVGGINLAVISYSESYVRELNPTKLFEIIDSRVSKIAELMEIDPAKVGVIIVSSDITKKTFPAAYNGVNILCRNADMSKKEKREEVELGLKYPARLPITSKFAYTNSVPSWLWTRGGAIKDDGAGVNLLGFVVRAGMVVMHRQTELSIRDKMAAYHRGDFGKLKIVSTIKEFDRMMKDLKAKKYNSIDTEATNLARILSTTLALQFTTVDKEDDIPKMWVLPMYHSETPWTAEDIKYIRKKLRIYFEKQCRRQIHVYQNAKFDIHQLMSLLGIRWYAAQVYDVSAGSFSLEENQKFMRPMNVSPYSLEHMEARAEYIRPASLVIAKKDRGRMEEFSMKDIAEYGVIDVLTPLYLMFEQVAVAKQRGYKGFQKFVTRQIGVMIMAMTEMEHNGIQIDMEYLREIASPLGPLSEKIREAATALTESDFAQKANNVLVEQSSYQKKGLFGNAKPPQLWSIRDAKHLSLLFFEILGLEPLGFKANGEGKLNAKFQKVYRHTPEVKMFSKYQKLTKLKSAFATAIYKFMTNHIDMKHDARLRPSFTYTDVLTGRSSTVKPSTQQLPTHGSDAKIIKRQFKVKPRRIRGKSDYAAHEVRVSGNLSGDPAICNAVDVVNEVQMKFRLASGEEEITIAAKLVAEEGDLHVQNYYTFFEVKISKKDERRQDAKTAVFAVTYGSLEKSIGEKMHSEKLYAVEDAYLAETDKAKKKELKKQLNYLRSEQAADDYRQKAKDLLKVLYKKWAGLTKFIEGQQEIAQVNNVVFGPHGRPRHLWGYLHYDKFIHFAMNRRVFNSQGQGYASDYGYTAIYLAKKAYYDLFISRGYKIDILQDNAVHDSSFCDMAFQFLPLYTYIQEHAMISLTQEYYKKHFGITPITQYGFDLEIGVSEDDMMGWNGRMDDMEKIIREMAPKSGVSDEVLQATLHDNKILGMLRLEELRSDEPYRMTLADQHIWDRIVPRLKCFKVKNG